MKNRFVEPGNIIDSPQAEAQVDAKKEIRQYAREEIEKILDRGDMILINGGDGLHYLKEDHGITSGDRNSSIHGMVDVDEVMGYANVFGLTVIHPDEYFRKKRNAEEKGGGFRWWEESMWQ